MNIVKSMKYTATVTIGLQKGYSEDLWDKDEVIQQLQEIQNNFIRDKKFYLSVAVSECTVVLSGQVEPSLKLDFINYPKFTLEEPVFKKSIIELTDELMKALNQNRVAIVFNDTILMIEMSTHIDPRIR
jgi:hypothetical protein